MSRNRVWYWINPADFAADPIVQQMTAEQEAIYRRLLDHCCIEGSIPSDPRRTALFFQKHQMSTDYFVSTVWPLISEKFMPAPREGRLVTRRDGRLDLRRFFGQLLAYWGDACAYCELVRPLAIEHVVPLARGGSNALTNLTLACQTCNSSKGIKTAEEFGYPAIHIKAAAFR